MTRPIAEKIIKAQAVSRGIATGKAVCLYGRRRQYFRSQIPDERVPKEIRRFRAAVRLAGRQLRQISARGENAGGILDFHKLMLADPELLAAVEARITNEKINAEWAVKLVTDQYLAQYRTITDERLRERQHDLEDMTERILAALGGGRRTSDHFQPGSVVVAYEINPSTLLEIAEYSPAAIVTEHGGWTSHTFILAREIGIPAVTGVRRVLRRIHTGDEVVVDGFKGEVAIVPSPPPQRSTPLRETYVRETHKPLPVDQDEKLKTLDARQIIIRANADIAGSYERARGYGAKGIGLFRSEYIFNRFRGVPTEDEQYEAYRRIAELAGDDGVRIRTFDFGSDDLSDQTLAKSKNPSLGLRAIRLSLSHERQFRDQLRALLRASANNSIDIIVPMVSDVAEIRKVRELLNQESQTLRKSNFAVGDPRLGVMVEVPSSVLMIEEILDESDSICLGTNDLVQYLLAVDRDNEEVAGWFRTLSPAVLKAVRTVLNACIRRNISCVVCGEMAGSPYYVPSLVGMGAVELSMNPNSIERIRRLISGIAFEETQQLVTLIEKCRTADEVETVNRKFIDTHWSHLYDPPSR
jgi:phosphotransferase system enzyme I (PtsI)